MLQTEVKCLAFNYTSKSNTQKPSVTAAPTVPASQVQWLGILPI